MSIKNDNIDFYGDLAEGLKGEKSIGEYLMNKGFYNLNYNNDKFWDVCGVSPKTKLNTFFEIKTDFFCTPSQDTGNLAIEIRFKGSPSGVSATTASYFVYYFKNFEKDNLWMIRVEDLRDLIRDNIHKMKVVMGGDHNNSELILIKRSEYRDYFYVDTHLYEEK